ncbi:MAG: agmatine deiminase family protein [Bacteroides sp.]|nr:agmatine deiminase family protein [Bacteroides sp.]
MKHDIYISEWLNKDYENVYNQFRVALQSLKMQPKTLPYSNDIWCRDFMPVHIGDGKYVGYNYQPDYLREGSSLRQYITEQALACEEQNIEFADRMDVVFDGGNFVKCGEKVLVTDKIFMENPQYSPLHLIERMEEAFQAEVILLPWDMEDKCGHADGMVAWLGDDRILLNNYRQLEKESGKPFTKRIFKILEYHFDIVELKYENFVPDSWCYLNYLEVCDAILLPAISLNHDADEDREALGLFQSIFPNRIIKQVFAQPLIKDGGALHCVTWNHCIL